RRLEPARGQVEVDEPLHEAEPPAKTLVVAGHVRRGIDFDEQLGPRLEGDRLRRAGGAGGDLAAAGELLEQLAVPGRSRRRLLADDNPHVAGELDQVGTVLGARLLEAGLQ